MEKEICTRALPIKKLYNNNVFECIFFISNNFQVTSESNVNQIFFALSKNNSFIEKPKSQPKEELIK